MNNSVINIAMFIFGAGVGSAITLLCLKKKYETLAQREIDSVKERFSKKAEELTIGTDLAKQPDRTVITEKPELAEYVKEIRKIHMQEKRAHKIDYSKLGTAAKKNEEDGKNMDKPYVITPDEFDNGEYEKIGLFYYADGKLADYENELVDSIEDTVSHDCLEHIGEYEEDLLHVRNDITEFDYEVIKDVRKYSDVVKTKPHQVDE